MVTTRLYWVTFLKYNGNRKYYNDFSVKFTHLKQCFTETEEQIFITIL